MPVFVISDRIQNECALIITTDLYTVTSSIAEKYPVVSIKNDNLSEFIDHFVKSYKPLGKSITFFMPAHKTFAMTLILVLQHLLAAKIPPRQRLRVNPSEVDQALILALSKKYPELKKLKLNLQRQTSWWAKLLRYWHIILLLLILLVNAVGKTISPNWLLGIAVVVIAVISSVFRPAKS
jgi:hypothetical protein